MTVAAALVLLAVGLLAWPVPTAAERRLARLRAVARVQSAVGPLSRANLPDRGRRVAGVGVAGGAVVGLLTGGVPVAVAAASAGGAVAVLVLASRSARRDAACRRDLLTALAVLRGELDAGASFPDAVEVSRARAGPAVAAFDLRPGDHPPPGDVVGHARRSLTAGAGLVSVTGAPWSAVAAGIGRDVAAADAREREVASALAGARASTVVLGGLPLLGIGLAAVLGADPGGFLLGSAAGRWVLAAGAVLDLLGVLLSTGVARRAAR